MAERVARGRSAREHSPRGSHAELALQADRDSIGWLEAQAATRLLELLPIRYGRMLASPLAFLRGAAAVMAHDLAQMPQSGLEVQLCGDAHLLNFGGFASPERDLVFDINDFDETLRGPFEWDVKRLASSVEVAGRHRELDDRQREAAVLGTVRAYRKTMRELAGRGNLDVWRARVDARALVAELRAGHHRHGVKNVERAETQARANDNMRALAKLTRLVGGSPRIVSEPPLIVPVRELEGGTRATEAGLRTLFRRYRRSLPTDRRALVEGFRYGDLARKAVGIGSIGTRCWMILLLGRDQRDPLFLQIKEAEPSVLEPFLGRSPFGSHGERVVTGQRLSQAASDVFLGWIRADDLDNIERDYYVRQLRDWKVSVEVDQVAPRGLATYAGWCGATLARAHARSGDRIAIAAYLGKGDNFDRAVLRFAGAYADLNERDHAALSRAVREGRIVAVEGV